MNWHTALGRRLIQSNGVIFILSGGFPRGSVSARSPWSQTIVRIGARILARRYNQDGPQVLADQRKQNTGALPLLSNGQRNQLRQLLEQAPPDGGLWTGPKVAFWMSGQIGRKIHAQRGWDYLKYLRFSLQIPRPRHRHPQIRNSKKHLSENCQSR
jgi:transposase